MNMPSHALTSAPSNQQASEISTYIADCCAVHVTLAAAGPSRTAQLKLGHHVNQSRRGIIILNALMLRCR